MKAQFKVNLSSLVARLTNETPKLLKSLSEINDNFSKLLLHKSQAIDDKVKQRLLKREYKVDNEIDYDLNFESVVF